MALILPTVSVSYAQTNWVTPAQYLQSLPKPYFAPGHHLPHLSRWGWQLSSNACIELATNWGYTLDVGECDNQAWFYQFITNNSTMIGKFVQLAKTYPTKFALSGDVERAYPSTISDGFFCTNSAGQFVDVNGNTFYPASAGNPVVCPDGSDNDWQLYAQYQIAPFIAIHSNAPVAIILNDGENEAIAPPGSAVSAPGNADHAWNTDPRVINDTTNAALVSKWAATNIAVTVPTPWATYAAIKIAHQMGFLTTQIQNNLPDREASVYYNTACEYNRSTLYQPWYNGYYNFYSQYGLVTNSDYPSFQDYYGPGGGGAWISSPFFYGPGNNYSFTPDLLTEHLNCVGFNMNLGYRLNYSWVCGGWWQGNTNNFSDIPTYTGFLKCLYTAGMVGATAGYFDYPNGTNCWQDGGPGFDAPFPANQPPMWLQQIIALSRVHATFWQFDDFLTNGDLLSGPQCHSMSADQPAYEFTNTAALSADRVLARKLRNANQWLITAWASDGNTTNVTVSIPTLGPVTVTATASACVYMATTTNLTLITDPVPQSPSLLTPPTNLKATITQATN